MVGMDFNTPAGGVPLVDVTICGFIEFRLIRITLLLGDVFTIAFDGLVFWPPFVVPITTGRAVVSFPSVGVNTMFGDGVLVLVIGMAVVTGRTVGEEMIVGFVTICGFVVISCPLLTIICGADVIICGLVVIIGGVDVVDVLKICDGPDSIILPSLSANRMGRSRIAERSVELSTAELSFAPTTVIDDDVPDALAGNES